MSSSPFTGLFRAKKHSGVPRDAKEIAEAVKKLRFVENAD